MTWGSRGATWYQGGAPSGRQAGRPRGQRSATSLVPPSGREAPAHVFARSRGGAQHCAPRSNPRTRPDPRARPGHRGDPAAAPGGPLRGRLPAGLSAPHHRRPTGRRVRPDAHAGRRRRQRSAARRGRHRADAGRPGPRARRGPGGQGRAGAGDRGLHHRGAGAHGLAGGAGRGLSGRWDRGGDGLRRRRHERCRRSRSTPGHRAGAARHLHHRGRALPGAAPARRRPPDSVPGGGAARSAGAAADDHPAAAFRRRSTSRSPVGSRPAGRRADSRRTECRRTGPARPAPPAAPRRWSGHGVDHGALGGRAERALGRQRADRPPPGPLGTGPRPGLRPRTGRRAARCAGLRRAGYPVRPGAADRPRHRGDRGLRGAERGRRLGGRVRGRRGALERALPAGPELPDRPGHRAGPRRAVDGPGRRRHHAGRGGRPVDRRDALRPARPPLLAAALGGTLLLTTVPLALLARTFGTARAVQRTTQDEALAPVTPIPAQRAVDSPDEPAAPNVA